MVKQVAGVKGIVYGGLGHAKHHFFRAEAGENSALRGSNLAESADSLDLNARADSIGERCPLHPVSSKWVTIIMEGRISAGKDIPGRLLVASS